MLLTVSSVRGSPGVTSWALLLAAAWPLADHSERVMLEADCAGGVLGARYQLGVEPGAVSLVSACRRRDAEVSPRHHARLLDDGLWAVPGPEVSEQAVPVWRSGVTDVAEMLSADQRLWVADLGRAGPESPVRPLVERAEVNIVLTRGAVEDVVQVPARVGELERSAPTVVVLVGRSSASRDELHNFLGRRRLWLVPAPADLPRLAMRAAQGGRVRRSPLWRAAAAIAGDLAELVGEGRFLTARSSSSEKPKRDRPPEGVGLPPTPPQERRLEPRSCIDADIGPMSRNGHAGRGEPS